jgi:hypothetical protein
MIPEPAADLGGLRGHRECQGRLIRWRLALCFGAHGHVVSDDWRHGSRLFRQHHGVVGSAIRASCALAPGRLVHGRRTFLPERTSTPSHDGQFGRNVGAPLPRPRIQRRPCCSSSAPSALVSERDFRGFSVCLVSAQAFRHHFNARKPFHPCWKCHVPVQFQPLLVFAPDFDAEL